MEYEEVREVREVIASLDNSSAGGNISGEIIIGKGNVDNFDNFVNFDNFKAIVFNSFNFFNFFNS